MKKLLFALLLCAGAASSAFGQSNPPLRLQEIDGTPNVLGVTTIKVTNGTLSCSGKVCTITISGGGGGGTPGGANTQVQYNAAGNFGGAAGFTFNGTSTISLGVAGTSVGAIGFRNATSGTITLQPVTGALGTVTLSLPAVTDTLVGLAATQTLSNKTLASPTVTGNISAEATSQMRYGSNVIAYEDGVGPKFTDSNTGAMLTFDVQNLTASRVVTWPNVAGNAALTDGTLTNGNCAEFDASGRIVDSGGVCGGGGSGITVGTTAIASGTNTRVLYNNSGVVGEYVITGTGNVAMSASPTFTGTVAGANFTASGTIVQTSASATAFESGPNGGTNPVFRLVNNVASAATGLSITGNAAGSEVTLSVLSSGTNESMTFVPKGSGSFRMPTNLYTPNSIPLIGATSNRFSITAFTNFSAPTADFTFAGGGGLRMTETSVLGTADAFFQIIPGGGSGYSYLESFNGLGLVLGTGNLSNPVIFRPNRSEMARITTTGFILGATALGTSASKVLGIGNGTAPSSSPADMFQIYSADSAAGDANAYARNEAGEVNRLTGLAARNSSSFAKTSDTTLANITGLTRNVEAGRTYAFRAKLQTTAAATGGVKFAVSGTATATSISYEGILFDTAAVVAQTRATALDTTVCASTTSTAGTCWIEGVVVVANAGTLTLQFAQNASDGSASTVLANQYFQLIPIS